MKEIVESLNERALLLSHIGHATTSNYLIANSTVNTLRIGKYLNLLFLTT